MSKNCHRREVWRFSTEKHNIQEAVSVHAKPIISCVYSMSVGLRWIIKQACLALGYIPEWDSRSRIRLAVHYYYGIRFNTLLGVLNLLINLTRFLIHFFVVSVCRHQLCVSFQFFPFFASFLFLLIPSISIDRCECY